jgi:hypothetical protein
MLLPHFSQFGDAFFTARSIFQASHGFNLLCVRLMRRLPASYGRAFTQSV